MQLNGLKFSNIINCKSIIIVSLFKLLQNITIRIQLHKLFFFLYFLKLFAIMFLQSNRIYTFFSFTSFIKYLKSSCWICWLTEKSFIYFFHFSVSVQKLYIEWENIFSKDAIKFTRFLYNKNSNIFFLYSKCTIYIHS